MKIIRWILISCAVLIAISVLTILYIVGREEGYYGPNKIGVENSYLGVRLGASKGDVLFALGKEYTERKKENGDTFWMYKPDTDGANFVTFGKNMEVIDVRTYSGSTYLKHKWLRSYTKPETVVKRLGKPDEVRLVEDGYIRIYRYKSRNLFIGFEQGKIHMIGITDYALDPPENGSDAIIRPDANWHP